MENKVINAQTTKGTIKDLYKKGQTVEATIVSFIQAGSNHPHRSALLKLKSGGNAFMLYNEIPGYPRIILDKTYRRGDTVDVEITAVRQDKNRLSVSLKPVLLRQFAAKLDLGYVLQATVIKEMQYGYFVDLGGGLEALLHNDNLDTDEKGRCEILEEGQSVEVVVIRIQDEGRRIAVGRKQLFEWV